MSTPFTERKHYQELSSNYFGSEQYNLYSNTAQVNFQLQQKPFRPYNSNKITKVENTKTMKKDRKSMEDVSFVLKT